MFGRELGIFSPGREKQEAEWAAWRGEEAVPISPTGAIRPVVQLEPVTGNITHTQDAPMVPYDRVIALLSRSL